ncbi:hypothetical protein PUN28_014883 [Cardiocondyla obscurior]|uniref:Uncharacterized protein n=1 Tax=Cardiocondyla obscurior TaxID=286306 RepID=A0AAW2F176_9HYME
MRYAKIGGYRVTFIRRFSSHATLFCKNLSNIPSGVIFEASSMFVRAWHDCSGPTVALAVFVVA